MKIRKNPFDFDEWLQTRDLQLYIENNQFRAPRLASDIIFDFYDNNTNDGINRGFLVTKDNKEIFWYDGTHYTPNGEEIIKDIVQRVMKDNCKDHYKNEVLSWVKDNSFLHIDRILLDREKHLINLENCIFNIKTNTIEEHDPVYFFTNKIPVNYDEKADCPTIKKFLNEIIYEDDIQVIQEWFGYCLYRDYPIHTACMLLGDGKNGKSTLLKLLTCFLGEENVANKELQNLIYNRFAISKLYRKMANIAPDIPDTGLKNTGLFKAITGGDRIDAEEKFKGSFEFTNYAKLIFSANKLPKSDDETYAFYRRWILISFPNTFEGDKCDPNIIDKLTTDQELSGLFNWAIKGLQRLIAKGKFSYGKTVDEIETQYKTLSDPIYAYCDEFLKCQIGEYIAKANLYQHYVEWAKKKRLPITANNMLTVQLTKHLPEMRTGECGQRGNQKPAYRNITWKNKDENQAKENGTRGLENYVSP